MSLKISLPLPPLKLAPNTHTRNGFERARLRKQARTDAGYAAQAAIREQGVAVPFKRANVQAVFSFKVKRTHDADNLNAWLKSYLDGFADAGVVKNDRDFELQPARQRIDPLYSGVDFSIEEA